MRDSAARVIAAAALGRRGAGAFAYWDAAADARFAAEIRGGSMAHLRIHPVYYGNALLARIMTGRTRRGSEDARVAMESVWNLVLGLFPCTCRSYSRAEVKLWEIIAGVESKSVWRSEMRRAVGLAPPRRYLFCGLLIRRRVQYLAAALVGYRAAAGGSLASAGIAALEAVGRLTDHPVAAEHAARIRRELGPDHAAWRRPAPAPR